MSIRIYVSNLSPAITEAALQSAFAPYGAITKIFVAMDRDTALPRYAFLTFDTAEQAAAAIAGMNGVDLEGQALAVSLARDPAPLPVRRLPAPPPPRRTGAGFGGAPRGGAFRR
jgi:transformer-2 protein